MGGRSGQSVGGGSGIIPDINSISDETLLNTEYAKTILSEWGDTPFVRESILGSERSSAYSSYLDTQFNGNIDISKEFENFAHKDNNARIIKALRNGDNLNTSDANLVANLSNKIKESSIKKATTFYRNVDEDAFASLSSKSTYTAKSFEFLTQSKSHASNYGKFTIQYNLKSGSNIAPLKSYATNKIEKSKYVNEFITQKGKQFSVKKYGTTIILTEL